MIRTSLDIYANPDMHRREYQHQEQGDRPNFQKYIGVYLSMCEKPQ
jgi:hypothetical protein